MFWIAASVVGTAAAFTLNGREIFLESGVSTFFINGKGTLINEPCNPPFWFITFSVVPFYKILLFSRDLITF